MKADRANILTELICHNGPQYVIPVYQRNYTWDDRNVDKLLMDIKRIIENDYQITHFIGSFVYVITDTINIIQERAIVDGQQRLTTVFLALYALRDLAIAINDADKAFDITSIYLENNVRQQQYRNKLKPLVNDDTVLQSIVERDFEAIQNSKSLVYQNYKNIKEEFKSWIDDVISIDKIIKAIDKLQIVWVQLDQTDDAQQIFESINSTGEALTAPDLIRNFILMNKNDDVQTYLYYSYWLKIEKLVIPNELINNKKKASKKLEEFFRFYLASKEYVLTNISAVYPSFKDYWNNKIEQSNTNEQLLNDICNYAKYFNFIFIKEDVETAFKKSLSVLRKIQSNMPTPFIMGICDIKNNGFIRDNQFVELIELMNIFLIRRHMCNEDTSSITRVFPTLLKDVLLKCKEVGYENIVDVTKFYLINKNMQKSSFMPTDDQITKYLSDANAYVLSHTKTFFDIIESDNPIFIDLAPLTVEHVLPQTSTDYWQQFIDGDLIKYAYYANLIGNLTLADKATNSEMSNKNFEFKKQAMERVGRINLSKEIIASDTWDYKNIIDRTKNLIKRFNSRFPYMTSNFDYDNFEKFIIEFTTGDTHAEAILSSNGSVELLPNSNIRKCRNRVATLDRKLNSCLESGIIEDNMVDFLVKESIHFSAVSTAIDFIYGGSNNGWLCWKDENGVIINDSLRSRIIIS